MLPLPGPERIIVSAAAEQLPAVRRLLEEYARSLDVDLCFQGFAQELAGLPGAYAPPRGRLLLALEGAQPAGCVALRPLDHETCEMKRLYVRPAWRGEKLGLALMKAAIEAAIEIGYRRMRLDTLPSMERALALYQRAGFVEIAPYYSNPVRGVRFLELALAGQESE